LKPGSEIAGQSGKRLFMDKEAVQFWGNNRPKSVRWYYPKKRGFYERDPVACRLTPAF